MEDIERMRIEELIGLVKHFETHHNKVGCDSCTWVQEKLRALQDKMIDYLKKNGANDDLIDWNALILEILSMDDELLKDTKQSRPAETSKALKINDKEDDGQFRRVEPEHEDLTNSDKINLSYSDEEDKEEKENCGEVGDPLTEQENTQENEHKSETKFE